MNKIIKLPSDVTITFWTIDRAELEFVTNTIRVSYFGYVSEDAYLDGKDKAVERVAVFDMVALSEKIGVKDFLKNQIEILLDEENAK